MSAALLPSANGTIGSVEPFDGDSDETTLKDHDRVRVSVVQRLGSLTNASTLVIEEVWSSNDPLDNAIAWLSFSHDFEAKIRRLALALAQVLPEVLVGIRVFRQSEMPTWLSVDVQDGQLWESRSLANTDSRRVRLFAAQNTEFIVKSEGEPFWSIHVAGSFCRDKIPVFQTPIQKVALALNQIFREQGLRDSSLGRSDNQEYRLHSIKNALLSLEHDMRWLEEQLAYQPKDSPSVTRIQRMIDVTEHMHRVLHERDSVTSPSTEENSLVTSQPRDIVNLDLVIRDLKMRVFHSLADHHVVLNTNKIDPACLVSGTQQNWVEIMMNLVLNAKRAIVQSHNAHRGLIQIEISRHKNRVVIMVKDNGNGVDLRLGERIFEPGVTTKKDDAHSGYGLSMVKQTVDALGGAISFQNQGSSGTIFTIQVPSA